MHSKAEYDNPYYYFTIDVAEKIEAAHCLTSDMLWIKDDCINKPAWKFNLAATATMLKWFMYSILYAFLLLMGIPTCGATWPREFRIWILSFGNSDEKE